jgi:hypothetical protein
VHRLRQLDMRGPSLLAQFEQQAAIGAVDGEDLHETGVK